MHKVKRAAFPRLLPAELAAISHWLLASPERLTWSSGAPLQLATSTEHDRSGHGQRQGLPALTGSMPSGDGCSRLRHDDPDQNPSLSPPDDIIDPWTDTELKTRDISNYGHQYDALP